MRQFSRHVAGARDFELGVERTAPVTYHVAAPDGRGQGLVFVISGFGDDAAAEYSQVVRRYLCGRHGLVAVVVCYHASEARPPAARIEIDLDDVHRVIGSLTARSVPVEFDGDVRQLLTHLERIGIPVTLAAKLIPPNGDYQNFGVMQAIDHLCVLNDILDSGLDFDHDNILCLGSSHGAYIAHLIHKFAPNTINGIIDNSGYTVPVMLPFDGRPECLMQMGPVTLACNVVTRWNFHDEHAPEFFGQARWDIRDAASPIHLAEIVAHSERRCQFRGLVSCRDSHAPPDRKEAQYRALQALGFDAQLQVVRESDLDGKVLKSLAHGLDASIPGLFDRLVGSLAVRPTTLDRDLGTSLSFECCNLSYRVRHSSVAPHFEASCTPIGPKARP
jgi:hypothetical protein